MWYQRNEICYVWKESTKEVITIDGSDSPLTMPALIMNAGLANCLLVDDRFVDEEDRHGWYNEHMNWVEKDLSIYPPEFKTRLLLLGVT